MYTHNTATTNDYNNAGFQATNLTAMIVQQQLLKQSESNGSFGEADRFEMKRSARILLEKSRAKAIKDSSSWGDQKKIIIK